MDPTAICPLETYPWRENLAYPVLDALEEANRLGIPDLFFGVWFDMEPQAGVHDYCFCDVCWKAWIYYGYPIHPKHGSNLTMSE